MALHITTGRWVQWYGGVTGQHDTRLFRDSGLYELFGINPETGLPPMKGLADRGYFSSKPAKKLVPPLWTGIKKPKNGELTDKQEKHNQILATLRIEVERGLGRLKILQRLVRTFRSSDPDFNAKLELHRKIFNVSINFVNVWNEFFPLRKKPHWLLGMGRRSGKHIQQILRAFMASPPDTPIADFLKEYEGEDFFDYEAADDDYYSDVEE